MSDEGPKLCPLLKAECRREECLFWMSSEEIIQKTCAIVVIAQQLDILARKGTQGRFG